VFVETLPEGRQFEGGTAGTGSMVALSPDGRTLAYVAEEGTETRLFIRSLDRLDQLRASPLRERGAREPFFSPDGQWLGFRVGQTLKRVFLQGGSVETIADLPPGTAGANGISWSPDGSILVGVGLTGLVRVAAAGGAVETLVTPAKERRIMFPQALPGGRAVLYTEIGAAADSSELVLLDLASGTPTPLRSGSNGRYLRTGHLVFVAAGTLWTVPFDVGQLKMNGAPVPVLTGVRVNPEVGAAQVALTESGALAYLPAVSSLRTLVWMDRQGKETAVGAPPRAYGVPRVSPDGARIAVTMKDGGQDIHLWDVSRRLLRQLTFDASPNTTVAWLNNERVTFSATVDGWGQVFEQRADGLEAARQVTRTLPSFPFSVSRDGAVIFVTEFPSDGAWDIGVVPVANPEMRQTVERTKDTETNPVLSPDGRWLTYQSNKTGRFEIYVRPFPLTGQGEVAVTDEGGTRPVWARDGSELYYWTAGRTSVAVKAIRITSGPPSSWDAPRMIVEGPFATTGRDTEYDVWDGRFLFMKDFTAGGQQPGREILIVQNLNDELGRLAPAK
jgi:serine/threonine-protein kinase